MVQWLPLSPPGFVSHQVCDELQPNKASDDRLIMDKQFTDFNLW